MRDLGNKHPKKLFLFENIFFFGHKGWGEKKTSKLKIFYLPSQSENAKEEFACIERELWRITVEYSLQVKRNTHEKHNITKRFFLVLTHKDSTEIRKTLKNIQDYPLAYITWDRCI